VLIVDYPRLSQPRLEVVARKFAVAWYDLIAAGAAFQWLLEHPSYREMLSAERQALIEAAVIAYCRPFVSSRGSSAIPSPWPDYGDPRWQQEHGALLEYRHTFVGHSALAPRSVIIEGTTEPPGWASRLALPIFLPGRAELAVEMCADIVPRLRNHLGQAALEVIRRERSERGASEAEPVTVTLPRP
jgi:hypothetical protein